MNTQTSTTTRLTTGATVIAFPTGRGASATTPRQTPVWDGAAAARIVALLRGAARDAQLRPPSDLDRLCAAGPSGDPSLWALALVRTAARGDRALVFHPDSAPMISATECWLTTLVLAASDDDGDSAHFLAGRFLAARDRRLAICFARRIAQALAGRAAA